VVTVDNWWVKFHESSNPDLTLLCFPYAGGNPLVYKEWHRFLDSRIQVLVALLPGRSTRLAEPCIDDMDLLIDYLVTSLDKVVDGKYAIFGHSLGSRVALQLCKKLFEAGRNIPLHFFASGSGAPHKSYERKHIHNLPKEEMIKELKEMNGTPSVILENAELMGLLLPMLRADFKLAETFNYSPKNKLPINLSVFHGEQDVDVNKEQAMAWCELFKGNSRFIEFEGNHFFVEKNARQVACYVNDELTAVLSENRKKIHDSTLMLK